MTKMESTYKTFYYRPCTPDEKGRGQIGPLTEMLLVSAGSLSKAHGFARIEAKRRDWRYLPDFTVAKLFIKGR